MNKRINKLAAIGISAAVTLGGIFICWPSLAANYTPVAGSSVSKPGFQKYMIMRAGDTTPQATFQYSVTAGAARSVNTADNGVMEVRAGISPEKVRVSDAVFTSGQKTYPKATASQIDVQRTDRTNISFEKAKGEKFAVSSSTVDFSDVSYSEPGIYRYLITETASASDEAKGIMHDEDQERVMDVYVTDNGSGSLQISTFVLHMEDGDVSISSSMGSNDVNANGDALADKTDGFTSEFFSDDLVFTQKVTGNQASRDKYFALTIQLSDLTAGDRYVVSLADDGNANTVDGNADSSIAENPNTATTVIPSAVTQPTVLTAGKKGSINQTFYLQDGQSVALRGLPANGKYSLSENAEDYKATGAVVTGYTDAVTSGTKTLTAIDTDNDHLVKTSYQNLRNGIVPTGVMFSVLPGAAMVLGGGLGAAVIAVRSSRKKEENE